MEDRADERGPEFLLAFDGRVHHLERGYWIRFEIRRVEPSAKRPHGLNYSFTLHGPDGARLIGLLERGIGTTVVSEEHTRRST